MLTQNWGKISRTKRTSQLSIPYFACCRNVGRNARSFIGSWVRVFFDGFWRFIISSFNGSVFTFNTTWSLISFEQIYEPRRRKEILHRFDNSLQQVKQNGKKLISLVWMQAQTEHTRKLRLFERKISVPSLSNALFQVLLKRRSFY